MRIIDAHTHIGNFKDDFQPIFTLAKRLNYEKFAVMSTQCGNLLQNLAGALCKIKHPGVVYAFGGLDYQTGRSMREQAEHLKALGYDGMKMLEGKPTTRRKLNLGVNDPIYTDYFKFCEETRFPVLLHIADPPEFWDKEKVPPWALERDWYYNETEVPYDKYYEEVAETLDRHPRLTAIFAHFYFMSDKPEKAQRFLDEHPNVFIDVTAGIEMYENFSLDPNFWRAFFIKNRDRIIFGTDSTDSAEVPAEADPDGKVDLRGYAGMEIEFLSSDKTIAIYGKKIRGIGLPEDTRRRILSDNFYNLVGEPKKIDVAAVKKEAEFIRGFLKNDEDKKTLDYIAAELG